jgi:Na+-transporting NADH:ubiquinone oxidoreductase subunit C
MNINRKRKLQEPRNEMKDKAWYPILYMFIVTAAFSSVLIGLSRLTQERIQANEQIAFERAVLSALAIESAASLSSLKVHEMYTRDIQTADNASGGALRYVRNETFHAYALPFEGQGFWAPIKGIIGIKPDKQTITGISFYEQNETPGLGAEIVKPAFCDQFKGKTISYTGDPLNVMTKAEGIPASSSEVEAVTGATQTSTRLERMVNSAISAWRDAVQGGEE